MNVALARRVLSQAMWYFIGNGSSRLMTLVVLILVGRALGPSDFGVFGGLLGLSLFLTTLAEMGLTTWATRRIAENREAEQSTLDIVATLSIAVTVFTLSLAGTITLVLMPHLTAPLLLILWFGCCTLAGNTLGSSLIARERPRLIAALSFVEKSLLLGSIVCFFAASSLTLTLVAIGASYAVAGTARLTGSILVVRRTTGWSPHLVPPALLRGAVSESWPFGLTHAIYSMGNRLDVFALALISATTAGLVGAALRLMEASFLIPQSLTLAVLPLAVRARQRSHEEFRKVCILSLGIAAAASIPLTLAMTAGSGPLLRLVYGQEFDDAAMVMSISAWCLPFAFVSSVGAALLNAARMEKRVYRLAFLGQSIRLTSMVVLAVVAGIEGAAVGVVLGSTIAFCGYLYVLRDMLRPQDIPELGTESERRLELSEAGS